MSTTTTPNLGLIKSAYNTEKDDWGGHLNDSFDLIDAFAGKTPIRLANGTAISPATTTITLSSSYTAFRLVVTNVSSADGVEAYLRFTVGASLVTTNYDFVRTDTSTKAGGTQDIFGASSQAAVILSKPLLLQSSDTDTAGSFVIDIVNKPSTVSFGRISVMAEGEYRSNVDTTGYITHSKASGKLLTQTARAASISIGGRLSSDYTAGIRCSYALFGLPGLA